MSKLLKGYVTTIPSLIAAGLVEVDIKVIIWSFHVTQQKILLKKNNHPYHSLKTTFQKSTKLKMTHSNIPIAVNATEMTIVKIVFKVFFKSGRLEIDILPNDLLDLFLALATSRCAFSISSSSSMDESKCLFLTSFPYLSGSLSARLISISFSMVVHCFYWWVLKWLLLICG